MGHLVIVIRDVINAYSPVVLAVPCTTYEPGKQIYPTQTLIKANEGGFMRPETIDALIEAYDALQEIVIKLYYRAQSAFEADFLS